MATRKSGKDAFESKAFGIEEEGDVEVEAEAPPTKPIEVAVTVEAEEAEHIPTTRGVGGSFRIDPKTGNRV